MNMHGAIHGDAAMTQLPRPCTSSAPLATRTSPDR